MSSRTRSYRPWLWSVAAVVLSAGPVAAQPPSPVELVRGLRENGQVDLALEYIKELERKPLAPDDKAALGLERAKCLLEASEDEPDEGTRVGMVTVAKEALGAFLDSAPNHPRRVEGLLAQAKLTTLDAREQLNRARRIDVPPPGESKEEEAARDAAQLKQKEEAKRARPLFLLAAKRYAEASALVRAKIEDKGLDANTRRVLEREAFEADLASGVNQFNTAETYMPESRLTGAEKEERNKFLEAAKETFGKLDKGGANNRTVWVARAWIAEVTYEQNDFNTAAQLVAAVLKSNLVEAADGKRLARFFQLRRNYVAALSERVLPKVQASEQELRAWLRTYGNPRKPTPEVFAVRYYLARLLQLLAESTITKPKDPNAPVTISNTARAQFAESERIYRGLSQAEHDYTARANRNRMQVVRRLLGDADQPVSSYDTFEKAQMASLIQLSKLATEEAKKEPDPNKIRAIRLTAIALLERARDLASPADSPADVTDVLIRLIYFYQIADMPYQAAVLGDHAARTLKSASGKAAVAGLLGLNGYVIAGSRVRIDPTASEEEVAARAAVKAADRARAVALAKFLDEKFPNDNATDAVRYRLGSMLTEDKRFLDAFEALLKVRPGYSQITNVRLLEGYLASVLVGAKDSPLEPAKKVEVFRRAVADLAKTTRPVSVALEDDVRGYISARCRLAQLMFAQGRVDPEAEKANPGYNQALAVANEVLGLIPTFDCLVTTAGGAKKPNLDGLEMAMLAQDIRSRALYIRARALIDAGNLDEAAKALEPAIADIEKNGSAISPEMKAWNTGDEKDGVQKVRVLELAGKVDKTRVEVILAGFRLRVRQGKAAEGAAMLDLVVKVGGTIEDNLPLLETLGRETAAKMLSLKKEGKAKEATELGQGLAVLLKKIQSVPKLSSQQLLFVGQMLEAVGEYDAALEALRKIPEPELKGWRETPPEKIPPEARGKVLNQIRDYAVAQLTVAKALRETKRFSEAEKMLVEIVGTPDKPGWGSGRLYFRKELAAVYEDRGASAADVKAANVEWGKALQIWTTIFNIYRARLAKTPPPLPPLPPTATDEEKQQRKDEEKRRADELKAMRNGFADAYLDVQRCLVKANQQLLKNQPPEKLQKTMADVAKRCADMEKQIPAADWDPEVQHRYVELLNETPALLASYKAQGGKLFLEKMPLEP
ncbi:MAG: hypothetical protein J0I06_24870 [Planctomycetes bacterium]|nr:hypothetical protein [Planctomycetota bacterium]